MSSSVAVRPLASACIGVGYRSAGLLNMASRASVLMLPLTASQILGNSSGTANSGRGRCVR